MDWHFSAILILFAATNAYAYPTPVDFDGSLLRWNITRDDPPIRFEVVADLPQDLNLFRDAVNDAAQIWTDVGTSYFKYAPVNEGETAQVTVNLKSALSDGNYSAGYAIFDGYDDHQPPRPTHCSIFVGITDDQSYYSISKTILHELGHCAGLGHTLIPEAIMSYSLDKNDYGLDIDDKAAVSRLYPQDGSRPSLPPGCSVGAPGRSASKSLSLGLLFAPLAILMLMVCKSRRISLNQLESKAQTIRTMVPRYRQHRFHAPERSKSHR